MSHSQFLTDDVIELKRQIMYFKKENISLKSENSLLKVRIRKLMEEIQKRNKQTESLINNPEKNDVNLRRFVSEKGASLVLQFKEENSRLEKKLLEKDILLKRFQSEMKMRKAYGTKYSQQKINISQKNINSDVMNKSVSITLPCNFQMENEKLCIKKLKKRSKSQYSSRTTITTPSNNETTNQSLSEESENQYTPKTVCEIFNLNEKFEITRTEIKELQLNFNEILQEVKSLKETILMNNNSYKIHHSINYCNNDENSTENKTELLKELLIKEETDEDFKVDEEEKKLKISNRETPNNNQNENIDIDFEAERLIKYHKLLQIY